MGIKTFGIETPIRKDADRVWVRLDAPLIVGDVLEVCIDGPMFLFLVATVLRCGDGCVCRLHWTRSLPRDIETTDVFIYQGDNVVAEQEDDRGHRSLFSNQ